MKKVLTGILVCLSLISYSSTQSTAISKAADTLSRTEQRIKKTNIKRRIKLLEEISKLESDYEKREEMTEKLRMDSEVRWKRDEYREILKKYEMVQNNIRNEIAKRQKELTEIETGLGIMAVEVTE